jgi:hypothetical protein
MTPAQIAVTELVQEWLGASLRHDCEKLCTFIGRGCTPNPRGLLNEKISNCGLFALAVWHAAGVKSPLLDEPYRIGMAIAWIERIATSLGAVRHPKDGLPTAGSLMHYYSKRPSTNDHVEFCLEEPDQETGVALHGGGGRAHCEIDSLVSDVRWSSGRPLQHWYDIAALLPEA